MAYPFHSALVTGASAGIGRAIAHRLGRAGIPTVLVARRGDRLQEIAAQYRGFEVISADLTTSDGLTTVEERLYDVTRPIDLLVNNAGFGTSGYFRENDAGRLESEIALNVQALVRLSHAAMRAMGDRQSGWIMNVSSVAGFQAGPKLAVYSATKAFVTNFSESLYEEGKSVGVKVTILCPGLTRTEFQTVSNTDGFQSKFPRFMWCTPEMVAEVGLANTARGKVISVPGSLYKVLVLTTGLLPRIVKRWIFSVVTRMR